MADPSRGRISLPPLHDEGSAFVIGGGDENSATQFVQTLLYFNSV